MDPTSQRIRIVGFICAAILSSSHPVCSSTTESVETNLEATKVDGKEESTSVSSEIINPYHQRLQRQGRPPPPGPTLKFYRPLIDLASILLFPLPVTSFILTIIEFALISSMRVDKPRLAALHQDMLNALAGLSGISPALVNPNGEDADGGNIGRQEEFDSSENETSSGLSNERSGNYEIIKHRLGTLKCENGRKMFGIDPLEVKSLISTLPSSKLFISQVTFVVLFLGLVGVQLFGLETVITAFFTVIGVVLLQSRPGGVQIINYFGNLNFPASQYKKSNSFGYYCDNVEELRSNVDKVINKLYK